MDTVGAFLGPLAAIGLLYYYDGDLKTVLWFAVLPAALTVALIVAGLREPSTPAGQHRFRPPLRLASLRHLPWPYWRIVLIGAGFWGLHMGFTEGILATLVAGTTPPEWKGSAFGLFNFVTGVFTLLASVIAGWLWDFQGGSATFYTGAGFAALVLFLTVFGRK